MCTDYTVPAYYKLIAVCLLQADTQFLGSYTLVVAPMGVKFGMEEGTATQYNQYTQCRRLDPRTLRLFGSTLPEAPLVCGRHGLLP